ncbi:Uncharacterised protein [Klebsiella pneumoniae]|nr:Uncharacterised protein [Klebsiella pneumoniae]
MLATDNRVVIIQWHKLEMLAAQVIRVSRPIFFKGRLSPTVLGHNKLSGGWLNFGVYNDHISSLEVWLHRIAFDA